MPETIGALILAVFSISATAGFTIAGVTITYASIVGATVLAAAEFALSSALLPSAPKMDGQLSLQQPVPFRRRIYGRAKVGGAFIFWTSVQGTLYSLIVLAAHEIDSFLEYWVADRRVALDGSGNVTSVTAPPNADVHQFNPSGANVIQILSSRGQPGKAAYSALTTAFPGIWTSACIGVGIADALLIEKGVSQSKFSKVYPGGQQTLRCLVQGARVYDPRLTSPIQNKNDPTTWLWSDNSIVVTLDYLTHADGWRMNKDTFLTGLGGAVTLASMNICDQAVNLKSGGTEKRYRLWGFYDFNEEPRQVLARMLASFGGWLQPFPDGTIGIRAGAWVAPAFIITDDMILGFEIQHFVGEFDAVNEVRATFLDANNDYQDTESTPWQDTADIARRGYIKSTSIDARHCPSYTQCRRIQKIAINEASPKFSISLTCSAAAIAGRNQKFLSLTLAQLGISGDFRVTLFSVNLETMVCQIGLSSFDASAYTWDPNTEEGTPPPIPPDSSSSGATEVPQNLTVNVQTKTISGANVGPVMVISCDAPTDRSDLEVKFEYQIATETRWTTLSSGTKTFETETAILPDGTYNVRASFFTPSGVQSDFAEVDGVVVTASVAAPGVPINLTATTVSPAVNVTVAFKAPNSATFADGVVWRNTTNNFLTAADISGPIFGSPNQNLSYVDTPGSGTWYYWVTAESAAGNSSAPTGPAIITI